jgi:hypothetical protein
LNLKSDRGRVQFALGLYLTVFVGLNLLVWTWFVMHRHGPHRFPLGERVERFGDILRFTAKYQVWQDPRMKDPTHLLGTLFPRNYPPFAALIYVFLLQVCAPFAVPMLCLIVTISLTIAAVCLQRSARKFESYVWYMGVAIFATALFGWATQITLMRGNIEGIVWIPICMGAWFYARRRFDTAGAAFGVACCLKPYPVLWLALMARHRKYRGAVVGLLTAMFLTLASLMYFDPNPIHGYKAMSQKTTFFEDYIVALRPMDEMAVDHSLFQTMKTIARAVRNHGVHFGRDEFRHHANDPLAWKLYHAYLPIMAVLAVVVLWKIWEKPILNQMFALACVTTVLPFIAADYTLLVLLIPMAFFLIFLLQDAATGRVSLSLSRMLSYLMPCAWIMSINPLWNLHGVLKCLSLLILLGSSVSIQLPSSLFDEIGRNPEASATE